MIPAMNVTRQYASIQDELDAAALKVLHSGMYILGKPVEEFEKNFAAYCGVKYAVGVANGSDALTIALKACGIKPGDEVITTAMSYIATGEAIVSAGAVPVFADCTKDTYTLDPQDTEKKITDKTKAVIPVHLYGQCADMDQINKIAKKHGLKVIEDAAQAAGSEYKGKRAAGMSDAGCVSFFPTKNLGAAGDGGMILTDHEDIYRYCRALRAHGSGLDGLYAYGMQHHIQISETDIDFNGNLPKYYTYTNGYNSRLDALQAALLNVKLPYLDGWNARRREIAAQYDKKIINPAVKKPYAADDNKHVYYVYAVAVSDRNGLRNWLEDHGIKSGVYFPVPLHRQRVFEKFYPVAESLTNAEFVADHTLVLPMFPELEQEEIDRVIDAVNRWEPE